MSRIMTSKASIVAILVLAALVTALSTGIALASTWTEVGDAGDLPSSAHVPLGSGALTSIFGDIEATADIDMYRICLPGGGTFSAGVTRDTGQDAQLFLFDDQGLGVYSSDDTVAGFGGAFLPAGDPLTPTAAGVYYLAVNRFNVEPFSAAGAIFSDDVVLNGPTGPGAGSPVSGWTTFDVSSVADYEIVLTGTEYCPEATLSIGDDSVTEGGDLEFTVSLSSAVAEDAVITYSTADGSATTADNDYSGQTNQTLTIPAGQTSGTITIATTPDGKFESDETLDVNLTSVLVNDSSVSTGPIFWTNWTGGTGSTSAAPSAAPFVGSGTITTGTSTVTVTYTNPQGIHFFLTGEAGEIDYWQNRSDFPDDAFLGRIPATSPYTSTVVENIPTGTDLIALRYAGSQTLEFSEVIANPVFA